MFRLTSACLLCLFLCAGARAETLQIAAASDLVYCLDALDKAFTAHHPDVELKTSTGSSGNFFAQIQQGAPFDVFLSADLKYPQALVDAGLADRDSLTRYAVGRLALWTRRNDIDPGRGLALLKEPGIVRIALASPEHAPYGSAAKAALEQAGLWQPLQGKIITAENIAQAAQYVDTGNADIGFVAWSLLQSPQMQGRGKAWLLPLDAFPRLEQGAVLTRKGAVSIAAKSYLTFLRSAEARGILDRYGFLLPDGK